jgi:hypothetical protein
VVTNTNKSLRFARGADPSKLEDIFHESSAYVENNIVLGASPPNVLDIRVPYENSLFSLDGYATLHWQHLHDINRLVCAIRVYLQDTRRKRPLNIIMNAAPGSGKSHFVECLAREMSEEGIGAVTFNMASMNSIEDLVNPLDAVRNLKVDGKLPLLLLDEFDTKTENYALLLPLLWDGEIRIHEKVLGVGKIVIILAGSKPDIAKSMSQAKNMASEAKADESKLVDLMSRINGPELTIPDLNQTDRKVDKICVTISLLRRRFRSNLTLIPWALLRFVSDTTFRHGVRSITNLVDLIAKEAFQDGKLDLASLDLPLGSEEDLTASHLSFHIIEQNVVNLLEKWKENSKCKELVQVADKDTKLSRVLNVALDELFPRQKFPPTTKTH